MVEDQLFKKVSIFVLLGVLGILAVILLWPITAAITTGLILAYVFHPIYRKILSLIKEKNISAVLVILMVLILIFIPLWFILPYLIQQVFEAYTFLQKFDISKLVTFLFPSLAENSQPVVNSVNNFISGLAASIFSAAHNLIVDLPNLALKLAIVLFVFFFGMRDGELLTKYIKSLSPFSKSAEQELAKKFKDITNSVIYGHVVVGIIQGIITGLGLFIFGVDNYLLLTLVASLAAMIPVLGAWLVWIPSSIYLISAGFTFRGIGLFLFGAIIVSWIDNILRPYIVSKKTNLSAAIVLVGMMGGLIVFGVLGLVIGPLILAYLLLLLEAYRTKKFPNLFSQ